MDLVVFLDYWKWFLVGIILSLFVAYTYIRYKNEIFQTTAKIKILDNSKGGMKLPSDVAALFSNSKVNLDNEIEVIKSTKLLEAPGIEPGAFRMQSERDTTTPRPRRYWYWLHLGL